MWIRLVSGPIRAAMTLTRADPLVLPGLSRVKKLFLVIVSDIFDSVMMLPLQAPVRLWILSVGASTVWDLGVG